MATAASRPRLRPIEVIVVPDERFGFMIHLRDTQGVAPRDRKLPLELRGVISRFNGRLTCEQIARKASEELGENVPVDIVVRVATDLEDHLFVHGPAYDAARARIEQAFADADVRAASHAGGAYLGDARELADYIDVECFGVAREARVGRPPKNGNGRSNGVGSAATNGAHVTNGADARNGSAHPGKLVALVAPHIDPWRGARCYGEAYGILAKALPEDVTTFVIFGTSHAPMQSPFALCRKAFDTPFGPVEADRAAIDAIARASRFDPYVDQFNHKREHSLEFQVVFLRHLLGARPMRIIPILAGLGEQQVNAKSPSSDGDIERFYDAVRGVVEDRRAVVVAGADFAHVGPRFGDPRPFDERERRGLDATDRESIGHAIERDAEGFFAHVARDLDTRRVCGLAPIYSLLRTASPRARGVLGHYEQTVDPEEGSIVSHAAVGFYE